MWEWGTEFECGCSLAFTKLDVQPKTRHGVLWDSHGEPPEGLLKEDLPSLESELFAEAVPAPHTQIAVFLLFFLRFHCLLSLLPPPGKTLWFHLPLAADSEMGP